MALTMPLGIVLIGITFIMFAIKYYINYVNDRVENVEKCINCESVYELETSNAQTKASFCNDKCEKKYQEYLKQPLEFKK